MDWEKLSPMDWIKGSIKNFLKFSDFEKRYLKNTEGATAETLWYNNQDEDNCPNWVCNVNNFSHKAFSQI